MKRKALVETELCARRDGWLKLLAHTLEYLCLCTDSVAFHRTHVIICLELASLSQSSLSLVARQQLAQTALAKLVQTTTEADPDTPPPPLDYVIQWGDMSGAVPSERDITGGVEDHGWLNVVHVSVGFAPPASDPDDVILGIALKSQLPDAVPITLEGVSVVIGADKGYASFAATLLPDETSCYYMPNVNVEECVATSLATVPVSDVKWRLTSPLLSAPYPGLPAAPTKPVESHEAGTVPLSGEVLAALAKVSMSETATSVQTSIGGDSEPPTPPSPWILDYDRNEGGNPILRGGRWQVFAIRFRPSAATTVKVNSVTLHFPGGFRAVWHVGTAYSINEPSTMPTLFSGCPATDCSVSITGPHAPFASSNINFIPGKLALLLHYESPPPVVTALPADSYLVNEPGRITITINPLANVTGAKLIISVPSRLPVSTSSVAQVKGTKIVFAGRIGASWESSSEMALTHDVTLPPLRKGEAHTVVMWIRADTPCDAEVAVVVEYGVGLMTDPVIVPVTVAEPFRFDTHFYAHNQESVLLRRTPISTAEVAGATQTVAPFNVAAGVVW